MPHTGTPLRHVVYACLPLGSGYVLDPFSGGRSAVAGAEAPGLQPIGIERNEAFCDTAKTVVLELAALQTGIKTTSC